MEESKNEAKQTVNTLRKSAGLPLLEKPDELAPEGSSERNSQEQAVVQERNKMDQEEEEEFQLWLKDPENKRKSLSLAEQMVEVMGNKWFTVRKLSQKSGINELLALEKIRLCSYFGLTIERTGNKQDGPDKNGQKLFKIVISNKDKIKAIDDLIQYHKNCIADFELAKKSLEGEVVVIEGEMMLGKAL